MTPDLNPQTQALTNRLFAVRRSALKPTPKLSLPQWADEYRMLPAESAAEPGRWKTSRVAVARGPMEAITDPRVHTVSVMCCTQLLKTELILNTIGFFIHQDPAPMIVMQPTVAMAEAFSKDRVSPMIRDTPALNGKVADAKARDSGNTILHKQFSGGHLTMIGANAPSELASRPIRVVLCDEIDKYPESAGEEGDPIKLLSERAATFWNYKRIFVCSPTIEGRSRIALEYSNGDERLFEVDCPHCAHRHEMQWRNVLWPKGQPELALYHCPECEQPWSEPARQRAVLAAFARPHLIDENGCHHGFGWRATKPFKGHASFRASKLSSPWEPVSRLAQKFEESQSSQQLLKTFINTQLAETWKEKGDAPEWQRLYERREDYARNIVPMNGLILVAWADVQKDRIEVEVVAFGRRLESWSVDYRVFPGDTSSLQSHCWAEMRQMLNEDFLHASGTYMRLDRFGIDSGYNTQTVYNFVRGCADSRVMATKGVEKSAVLIGIPRAKETRTDGKRAKRGVKVWDIGLNLAKPELYSFLRLEKPTEPGAPMPYGFCHFPQYDEEYFKMLTAEQSVSKIVKGYTRYEWVKTRERNEALDCRVGARAIASAFGVDRWKDQHWQEREGVLGVIASNDNEEAAPAPQQKREEVQQKQTQAAPKRKKSSFW